MIMSWLLGNWGGSSGYAGAGAQPPLGGGSGGKGDGDDKSDADSSQQQTFSVQETKVRFGLAFSFMRLP